MSARYLPLVLLWSLSTGACGTRFADAIVRDDDVCAAHSAAECALDSADGCSLQPNPTGCVDSDPACGAGVCRGGDPFVRRSGERLFLHGAPFHFVGAVSWWAAWPDTGCKISAYESQESALGPSFDELAAMHVSVLRFWAFQSYAGASGTDYSHFERLVARARAAGVRLLPVLENQYSDCTASPARDDAWYAGGYRSPYGNYALSYRDYVAGVAAHFRAEPTIVGWELMHEAGAEQFSSLDAFVADVSAVLRAAAPNHLIALGVNNGNGGATSSDGDESSYYRLHAHPAIDLLDVHDFSSCDDAQTQSITRCRAIAHALEKPIFIGAAACELSSTSSAGFAQRAARIERKLAAAQADDFAGFLVYDYAPGWSNPSNEFDARPEEPLAGPAGVLARSAPAY